MHRGACLCGAVRFAVDGGLAGPDACHCSQCRRWSGHVWASTDIERQRVTIEGEANLAWFQSSPQVRRGFCATCGSALFWDKAGAAKLAIAMGAFDAPTGTRLAMHIHVADKGDYYELADGVPQHGR